MPSAAAAREAVVAVAQVDGVVALARRVIDVRVGAAEQRVGGVGAVEHVRAGAAVERERDPLADAASALMKSMPPRPKTVRRSSVGAARSRSGSSGPGPRRARSSMNGRTPMLSKPSVPWTWIWSRAPSSSPRSASTREHAGVAQVADVDQVLPAGGVDVERLDGGAVGGRGAGVACDPRLAVEGLQRELLRRPPTRRRAAGPCPLWPSTVSKPSPWKTVSSPAPRRTGVVAAAGRDLVAVVAGRDQLGAGPADDGVGARAGLDRRRLGQRVRRSGPCRRPPPERIAICVNVARLKLKSRRC